jgi:hypothetical protein
MAKSMAGFFVRRDGARELVAPTEVRRTIVHRSGLTTGQKAGCQRSKLASIDFTVDWMQHLQCEVFSLSGGA